jgi:tRNA(Arg) A34 adenosine deaminase TadA
MCLGAIYWARPEKLYYGASRHDAADAGFDDHFIYQEIKAEIDDRKIETRQMLHDEAQHVFDLWKKTEKKIPY